MNKYKQHIETLEYLFIITTLIYIFFVQTYKETSMYNYLHFSNHMAVKIIIAVGVVCLAVVSPIFSLCLIVGYITTLIEYKRRYGGSKSINSQVKHHENMKNGASNAMNLMTVNGLNNNNIDNMYVPISNDVSHPADNTITENLHKTDMEIISNERLSGIQGDVNNAFDKYGDGLFTNPNNIPSANDNKFHKSMLMN